MRGAVARVRRRMLIFGLALAALGGPACVHVRPHQRERLAHESMKADDWAGAGEAHARAVREGATGAGSVGEAGCGCN